MNNNPAAVVLSEKTLLNDSNSNEQETQNLIIYATDVLYQFNQSQKDEFFHVVLGWTTQELLFFIGRKYKITFRKISLK